MTVSPETKHILLLDADAEMREQMRRTLLDAGHRVSAFPGFRQATRNPSSPTYDALVAALDWSEANNSRRVRTLKRHAKGIPLLVVAPPEKVDQAIAALRYGADEYLLTPPDPYELAASGPGSSRSRRVLRRCAPRWDGCCESPRCVPPY
jgi:DNA-binding response OmpR family regulator